jgi:uncharacterized membrane protein
MNQLGRGRNWILLRCVVCACTGLLCLSCASLPRTAHQLLAVRPVEFKLTVRETQGNAYAFVSNIERVRTPP